MKATTTKPWRDTLTEAVIKAQAKSQTEDYRQVIYRERGVYDKFYLSYTKYGSAEQFKRTTAGKCIFIHFVENQENIEGF